MAIDNPRPGKFPLLEGVLSHAGLQLQGTYSVRDVAKMFGVSVRAIQDRVKRGQLDKRDLPGRAKFLSIDLEEFLKRSAERHQGTKCRVL